MSKWTLKRIYHHASSTFFYFHENIDGVSWMSAHEFFYVLQTRTVVNGAFEASMKVGKQGTQRLLVLDEGKKHV